MRPHTEAARPCLNAIFSFVLITFLWALPIASWAVMEGIPTEDLARGSDLVVLGDIESAAASWSNDHKTIFTTAIVEVAEVIKGRSVSQKIEIEYPGGEVGDIGMRVSDEPGMEKGEKVLLFLKHVNGPDETHKYNLVGKGQGKYSIGPDGIARKKGYSLVGDPKQIDAEVPIDILIEKIKGVK
jgi:hypothetical protein